MKFDKLAKVLLIISIASLFIRKGDFFIYLIPKPFEIFLFLSVVFTIIDIFTERIYLQTIINTIGKSIARILIILVISAIVGLGITIFVKGIPLNLEMLLDFLRMIISLTVFVLTIFYIRKDDKFIKKLYFALLSPLIYGIIFLLPKSLFTSLNLVPQDNRFIGLTNNPSVTAKLLMTPFMFLYTMMALSKKSLEWVLYIIGLSILAGTIFWTGSRQVLIAIPSGIIFILFIIRIKKKSASITTLGIMILFTIIIGINLIPEREELVSSPINIIENNLKKIQLIQLKQESRLTIYSFFIKQILKNPLGAGPAYYSHTFPIIDDSEEKYNAHNIFLGAAMNGGWIGLTTFIYLIWLAFKNLKKSILNNGNYINIGIAGALVAILTASMFDDTIRLYWLWTLLAMAIAYKIPNLDSSETQQHHCS